MRSDKLTRDDNHVYRVGKQELTSVTKFIKQHWPEFNADEERWDGKTHASATAEYIREEMRGMGPVTKKYQDPFHYTKKLFGDDWERELTERENRKVPINAREVKKYWELKGAKSAEEGTRIHDLIERALVEGWPLEEYMDEPLVVSAINFYNGVLNKHGYDAETLAELQIYSMNLGLAGTIDLLLRYENKAVLVDWKTNNSLDRTGYKKGMTPATALISDGNLNLYELQLSLYAYILETEYGLNISKLYIYHLSEDDCKSIEVEYKKDLIKQMLVEDNRL